MAAIELQAAAKRNGKRLGRPKVKSRKSAMSDTSTIVEVTAPDGTGLLIEFGTSRDHTGLTIHPYRADKGVRLRVHNHTDDCALGNDSRLPVKCDCGADLKPKSADEPWNWVPTEKGDSDV